MKRFISYMMKRARGYTVWDFGCLKLTMLTLGILIGAYFSAFFTNWLFAICSIFVLAFSWLIYRTFLK